MKKGFTLVELAIVLVIIGLLIGGILVAKSMINTAKINSFVRQIQQYDVAVGNFGTNFKGQIPGDSSLMDHGGNNDGIMVWLQIIPNDPGDCVNVNCREHMFFWKHLSDTAMLKDKYNSDFSGGNFDWKPGVNCPGTPFGKSSFLSVGALWYGDVDVGIQGSAGPLYNINAAHTSDLPMPADYFAVEKKIDDNDPATGTIRGYDTNVNPCSMLAPSYCAMVISVRGASRTPLER